MSALCSKNFFTSICKLLIPLMYIYASRKRKADLCQIFKSFDCNSTISLEELNELSDDYWYFKEYISCKLIEEPRLVFELYPNFTFDPRYFDDILRIKDLMIGIRFNENLKELVHRKIVNPSEYVDRFLEHLLHLKNLEHFSFSGLNLTEIPKMIYKFKNLKALNLENNGSDKFKIDWEQLPNLKYLSVGGSEKLTKIDKSFFNLSSLVVLRISDCSIAEIPRDINKLRNLVTLCIYKTPIKSFPRNLSNLKKLQYLSIFNCTLEELVINMLNHPKLKYLYLHHNRSLKRLKIMISEIPLKLKFSDIGYCPLEDVEFWVSLKNTKFGMCYHKNQQLDHFDDYVIKFNPCGLKNFSKTKEMRKLKTFEYYINSGPDLNKTILIREIDLDKTKVISRNALVFKWNSICKKIQMVNKPLLHDEYKQSIEFMNNLYEAERNDYSDAIGCFPFEYKNKMILILSDLFDQLEENILVSQVKSILEIFKRPHSEKLVYFNYLLKYSKSNSCNKKCFITFIKESIEILKDYVFTICLNLEEYDYEEILNKVFRISGNKTELITENFKTETFDKFLKIIINAKKNFDYKFTIEYFSDIIENVIARIGDSNPSEIDEMIESLLINWEVEPEYFEYETQANVDIIRNFSTLQMKFIIESILNNDQTLISDSN